MKHQLILAALFFRFPFFLQAQYDDLLMDNNISWVAEYTADFQLNPFECRDNEAVSNSFTAVKFLNSKIQNGLYEYESADLCTWFAERLLADIQDGRYPAFEEKELRIPIMQDLVSSRLSKYDTMPGFDHPYDTIVRRDDIEPEEIESIRARFVFFYHHKTKAFGSRLLALAPVVSVKDLYGEHIGYQPVIWVKMERERASLNLLQSNDIALVAETKMRDNAPRLSDFVIKKGRFDFVNWVRDEVAAPTRPCFDAEKLQPLSRQELQSLAAATDTIATFDPVTQTAEGQVLLLTALDKIGRISFVHQWYYDEKYRRLNCRLTAVAPVLYMFDWEGNFGYSKPLFYQVVR